MTISKEQIDDIKNVFTFETHPNEVDEDYALHVGRLLKDNGYRMIVGVVIKEETGLTIEQGLTMHSSGYKYKKRKNKEEICDDLLFGPYYSRFEDGDFAPVGFAVWKRNN